jgi:hypothetical protein
MAHVDENDVTLGLRGRFGKQFVFRKVGGRTIVSRRSKPTGGNTVRQVDQREKFRLASLYAKRCLLQPALKEEYEAMARAMGINSAFPAALGDFLNPVQIREIVTVTYAGEIGYPLAILVSDVLKVKTMTVVIMDADGDIIESGPAIRAEGAVGFTYVTTVAIPVIAGVKIRVEVKDRPGNTVSQEVAL